MAAQVSLRILTNTGRPHVFVGLRPAEALSFEGKPLGPSTGPAVLRYSQFPDQLPKRDPMHFQKLDPGSRLSLEVQIHLSKRRHNPKRLAATYTTYYTTTIMMNYRPKIGPTKGK